MSDSRSVSKMELAKALKSIRDVTTPEDFSRIQDILAPPETKASIEQAIKGLAEEDEFALMCRLMGTATHLVRLDQRPVIAGDHIAPDYLARFQPSCSFKGYTKEDSEGIRCLVEVKSTTKDCFKLKGSLLRRRRLFADEFDLPLFVAVRFLRFSRNSLWVIVEDDDRSSNPLTVTYQQLIDGVRHVLWDDYWYTPRPGMYLRATFDADTKEMGVTHPEYGIQTEFQVVADNQTLTLTDAQATFYSAFFQSFALREVEIEQVGSTTHQTLIPEAFACPVADTLYIMNRLPQDRQGRSVYDASRIVARSDLADDGLIVNRDFIEGLAQPLVDRSLLFLGGFGDQDVHLEKWRRYGGKK